MDTRDLLVELAGRWHRRAERRKLLAKRKAGSRGAGLRLVGAAALLTLLGTSVYAAEARSPLRIHPGAIELGVAGDLVSVGGTVQGSFAARGGVFLAAGPGALNLEVEPSYSHVHGLDRLDLQAAAAWQIGIGSTAAHAFAGIGGGLRQEWLGSFEQLRVPVGVQAGVRALVSESAGIRLEYRYRRILDDPIEAYDEHGVWLGVSLFLGNRSAD